jgi:hypothetical protein
MIKKMYIGLHVKCPSFLSDFNETYISSQILDKYLSIKFHEKSSTGEEFLHADSRIYRHDGGNSHFSQFCESAKKKGKEYKERMEIRTL